MGKADVVKAERAVTLLAVEVRVHIRVEAVAIVAAQFIVLNASAIFERVHHIVLHK